MRTMLAQPGLFAGVMLSLTAAWLVTAVALGIVFLFVAAWSGTAPFRRAVGLVSPLLAVPHAAAAFGLAFLIAPAGFLARVASPQLTGWERPPDLILVNDPAGLAMMAGLIAKEIPFLLLITLAALPQIEAERTRALTLSLGYGRIAGFCFAAWPRLYPQIRLATFAVLAFSSSVVDVGIILGPTTPPPLSVQLTRWMQDPDLTMRFVASAGALLQLAVTGTCDSLPRIIGSWHTHPFHADQDNRALKSRQLSPQDLATFAASTDQVAIIMWDRDSLDAAVKAPDGSIIHPASIVVR